MVDPRRTSGRRRNRASGRIPASRPRGRTADRTARGSSRITDAPSRDPPRILRRESRGGRVSVAQSRRPCGRARRSGGTEGSLPAILETSPRDPWPGPPGRFVPASNLDTMIETQSLPTVADGARKIGFLIVGTPRSGTTLVQRLVSELPGVRVPPETHFFPHFGLDLIRRRTFPLDDSGIHEEVGRFLALKTSRGLDLAPAKVATDLGGRCSSGLDLFQAIVRSLAGPAEMYGEKTPNHLLWWRPLSSALPGLRLIAVVRDPRAVTSSYASAPFGMDSPAALAESWVADQREVLAASGALGDRRCVIVRYEDVVDHPEHALETLREFLDRPRSADDGRAASRTRPSILMPWETWKANALGPVVKNRVEAWRTELSSRDIATVTTICRSQMRAFGYEDDTLEGGTGHRYRPALSPVDQWRRWHFRIARLRRMKTINSTPI